MDKSPELSAGGDFSWRWLPGCVIALIREVLFHEEGTSSDSLEVPAPDEPERR
jgi:hypothetical protein